MYVSATELTWCGDTGNLLFQEDYQEFGSSKEENLCTERRKTLITLGVFSWFVFLRGLAAFI